MTQLSLSTTGRTGYAAHKRRSPSAMAAAVVFNGGVMALLLALPAAQIIADREKPLPIKFIELPPEPKEKTEPVKHDPVKTQSTIPREAPFVTPPVVPFEGTPTVTGTEVILPPVERFVAPVRPTQPVHVPVYEGASRDPRFADAFTPPYPIALQREGLEGSVTVRITINEQGRVIACDLVKATNRAFYDETREQALKRWRFRPATSDGVPVQSQQTLTVHFQLDA